MKTIYNLALFAFVLCIISCKKDLPYPDIDKEKLMVLNGMISPESGVNVHLSENCHIADANCLQKNIENAEVNLMDENGTLLTTLTHQSDGFYAAESFTVEANKTYKIEAKSNGFETVFAEQKTPNTFACLVDNPSDNEIEDFEVFLFDVTIEDKQDESNYYLIDGWVDILNGEHDNEDVDEVSGYIFPHTGFLTIDINAENKEMVGIVNYEVYPLDYIFITDENLNGQDYSFTFGLHELDIRSNPNFELEAHISVKSVSKEMYEYFKSITLNKLTNSSIISEPVPILSTIQNGLGVFGAYSEQIFIIELPKSEFVFPNDFVIENEGCTSPCAVNFYAEIGEGIDFFWDFGDGSTSTAENPSHMYQSPGEYNVELIMSAVNNEVLLGKPVQIN